MYQTPNGITGTLLYLTSGFITYKESQSLFCVSGDEQHWIYAPPA